MVSISGLRISGLGSYDKVHFVFPSAKPEVPLHIESLGYNPYQESVRRPSGHHHFHWIQTVDGEGEIVIGARRVRLEKNQGLMLLPAIPHQYEAITERWSTAYLTFGGPLADEVTSALGLKLSTWYQWSETSSFSTLLFREIETLRETGWGNEWTRSEVVYRFLLRCRTLCHKTDEVQTTALQDRMGPLFQHIVANLENPSFGVQDMADFLHVSPRHLTELFRKIAQTSPYQHLQDLRLTEAKRLLRDMPSLGVKEVAARVGFRDPSHFILAFRKATGQSPGQFRKVGPNVG